MTDRQTLDVYDRSLEAYLSVPILDSHAEALQKFIAGVPRGGRVLDLGCGPGVYAEKMVAAGLDVDAVDATPTFVAEARARGLTAREAVFEDTPGDQSYDGIWASFSLLHAPRADVAGHVQRLAQSLTARGVFFLGMKTGSGEARDDLGRFYSYFSVDELRAMLERAGLTVTDCVKGNGKGLAGGNDTFVLLTAIRDA